ncbi:kinesin-like protein KIN-7D, mitochondrial [Dioscorea cayenensis subsp. rotundata]|uniref:Kinesin-like protein KIN-7D, mitochondrial n=1 Tax=Dioscorea cayennensis subsp. rotundata TaxID=55577 RepID=A0AB40C7P7_DIOCR|nr:kinesin-like protein KIN-7D, mitochondrial [Dioscorea cayenensis subsp. rotundata]
MNDEIVEELNEAARSGEVDSISVTVRFRPLSEGEFQQGDNIAWYADGDKVVRNEYNPATTYAVRWPKFCFCSSNPMLKFLRGSPIILKIIIVQVLDRSNPSQNSIAVVLLLSIPSC